MAATESGQIEEDGAQRIGRAAREGALSIRFDLTMESCVADIRIPQQRKALFREHAREIVRADRSRRKYGLSVDTAGAIVRALEQAFKAGVEVGSAGTNSAGLNSESNNQPNEWLEVPPRPRKTLWRICLHNLGSDLPPRAERPVSISRQGDHWVLGDDTRDPLNNRSVQPLVKLGLLEPADSEGQQLQLTALARDIWWRAVANKQWLDL